MNAITYEVELATAREKHTVHFDSFGRMKRFLEIVERSKGVTAKVKCSGIKESV